MPKFKYTANDASGRTVVGWINAEDLDAARMLLTSDGTLGNLVLTEVPVQSPEIFEEAAEESEIEVVDAEEVGAEVVEAILVDDAPVDEAEPVEALEEKAPSAPKKHAVRALPILEEADRLIQQGIPLGEGLRAIAEELPGGKNTTAIRALAERLDAGDSLHEAMVKLKFAIPRPLQNLIESGVSTGHLSVLLHQLVLLEQERRQLWQKSFTSIAYPGFLLTVLAGIFILFGVWLIPDFKAIFDDFGTELPTITKFTITLFGHWQWFFWGVILLVVILYFVVDFLPFPRPIRRMAYWIPLVGPIRRWHRLARCTRLMALLTDQHVPLPAAIRIAADGAGHNDIASACRMTAKWVEHGMSFPDAADQLRLFPPSCASVVRWGSENNALPESLEIISEIAKTRMNAAGNFLNVIAAPLVFLIFLLTVPLMVCSMFMPLIKLITTLS